MIDDQLISRYLMSEKAKEEGMTFLREAALGRVFKGQSTLHEINKVTFVD